VIGDPDNDSFHKYDDMRRRFEAAGAAEDERAESDSEDEGELDSDRDDDEYDLEYFMAIARASMARKESDV
jgi:hypothetical protein